MKIRPFWVLVHRYAGLAMTAFLIVVGLTGSLLAFYEELDGMVSPQFYVEPAGRQTLPIPQLLDSAERALGSRARVASLWLSPRHVDIGISPNNDSQSGQPLALGFDQLILDPYTGAELGRRQWGAITEGAFNLMPFVYKLHYNLALDEFGAWTLGITALVWTLDCFVGFYLTLPAKPLTTRAAGPSFWQRWRPAWAVKWRGSPFRINYDLHRAGGLWVWIALLAFAWSSVYMNLGDTVYAKVMQSVSDFRQPWTEFPELPQPLPNPPVVISEAFQLADAAARKAGAEQGFAVLQPAAIWYNPGHGFYVYSARSDLDFQDKGGQLRVVIDAVSGAQKMLLLPSGQYNGNTITVWLAALHMANVFGLPYRIFVCLLGLTIVMLSVTGVVIWLKKRRPKTH